MTEKRIGIIDCFPIDVAISTHEVTEMGNIVVATAFTDSQAATLLDRVADRILELDALLIERDLSKKRQDGESARIIIDRVHYLGISPFLIANSTIGMPEHLIDRFDARATKLKMSYFEDLKAAIAMIDSH